MNAWLVGRTLNGTVDGFSKLFGTFALLAHWVGVWLSPGRGDVENRRGRQKTVKGGRGTACLLPVSILFGRLSSIVLAETGSGAG